ncbi:CvpA family protein [Entomospira entomophila]|uniref:Colicin V production protein n=1 Tax=Entomospira entomophila TaxID=2719988 RepID=A0A968G971_9SPIO|nr:CvpA family protein [Entomospira entomophilus]NIZ40880.1 hypothetical protein [Entomospira entomophilus]WDI35093.1 CvpA family protein [Entomospira entomophilus]
MQQLDIIFIALSTIYILRGLITGLVSSSISILSKAAALFLAVGLMSYVTFLTPFFTFWGVIIGFLLLTSLFRIFFLKKNKESISLLDRFLGMVIGALDAVFISGLITYFILSLGNEVWIHTIESSVIGNFLSHYIYQARSITQI